MQFSVLVSLITLNTARQTKTDRLKGAELAVAAADIAATAAEAAEIATMAAGFEAEGATAAEAAAKAAAKAATSKTVSTAGRTAGILLAHDTIASVTMYEIMTARYADGT